MWEKLCNRVMTALDLNQATLSGSSDIICVKQKPSDRTLDQVADDGWVYKCTPFHVRFGKAKLLRSREKRVSVYVNGQLSTLSMKLGSAGEAYFREGVDYLDSLDPSTFSSRTDKDSSKRVVDYGYYACNSKTDFGEIGSNFDYEAALMPEKTGTETPNSADNNRENVSISVNLTPTSTTSVTDADQTVPFSKEYYRQYTVKPSPAPLLTTSPMKNDTVRNLASGDFALQFSLCGHLLTSNDHLLNENLFHANLVDFQRLSEDPKLWYHESLVACFDLKPPYYPIRIALPLIASWMVFNKPLSIDSIEKLLRTNLLIKNKRTPNKLQKQSNYSSRGRRITLRPTSQQLASLPLKYGQNKITFSVYSALQGVKSVHASVYLLPSDAKIVISDVDGTITKSNALGHIMPIIGRDWTHSGVAELFTKIRQHGYFVLYLSARAIGQADLTRDYLFGLTQNAREKLPKGPLFLSPDRLVSSLKREVITKSAYMFKIPCLRDIHSLFPQKHNPFYAGFGNNSSDHRAYVSVGVPESRVFIINPSGLISHVSNEDIKTYDNIVEIADSMFPKVTSEQVEQDEELYNSSQFWNFPVLKESKEF
ncbi:LNS2 (Lipin/Ned1/Smp2) family protein [Theileria parva strain Muguga]|uniref:LNS2 (Lipin/Ned1/Smp2) family protein n=1 Tax=Theileria parva strain Muguga TaxID=333668 RepID=UPI001C61DE11|nr:LNS2 (Lipin/Ned1/Smp2) family protein [Theileria parva strain Muguga]EAN31812.2 LNS2 (Lipin/Ned1/Smp2) family protein [Theileria parva strain Muguga]